MRIYKRAIGLVVTYGVETMCMTGEDEEKAEKAEEGSDMTYL